MRILTAALICLFAPAALAQDLQQLENEHVAALQARDRLAAEANAAVETKEWRLACIKGGNAVDQNDKAANLLKQLRDAVEGRVEPQILQAMSANVTGLLIQSSKMRDIRDRFCAEANKPS